MTDQAESGASTVFAQYEAWADQSQRRWKYDELTAFLAGYQQCRADLERVTAERDAMREVMDTAAKVRLEQALANLRKAAADAEEGK